MSPKLGQPSDQDTRDDLDLGEDEEHDSYQVQQHGKQNKVHG